MTDDTAYFFLIKDEEKKRLFIEELKSKLPDFEFKILDASQYQLGERKGLDSSVYENDLKGIPKILDNKTVFNGNEKLPHEGSCSEKGILIFENVHCADNGTMGSIDNLLDNRQLFNYKLPKEWRVFTFASSLEFKWCGKIISRGSALGIN